MAARGLDAGRVGKPVLAPRLEHRDRHRVGEIQAALTRAHRQPKALFGGDRFETIRLTIRLPGEMFAIFKKNGQARPE